ncbi:short chain dehydrogenase/reductase [Talaromyces proteolyticus]|uniref:Short chain dehydrogenase/reductase n=1 Tax=Talaromyces proteolyticus TaxID=1131652 RepID=A0AAD4L277_9EURO|nr:short chain dehydrogenase/reductase [Talaromyces proteolyticus]KAH8703164.1 short chain dehydrogenase/reductase [Talaromyces proteolyticus]
MSAVFREGATALITGGASGIGLATAKFCYAQGMNVVLLDINKDALSTAAAELPSTSTKTTSTFDIDVSAKDAWKKVQHDVLAKHPSGIDFLMLNAGTSIRPAEGKTPWQDPEYFEKTIAINTFGYIHGLAAFLDIVTSEKTEQRAIVLTGSKQGITNPPGNPAYNASKSAVKTIAEQLSFDLHTSNPNVGVHLLIPGWTYTGLTTRYFKTKPDGAWTSEQVVEYMTGKLAEGVFYILCPDNEVTEELDRKRVVWGCGDLVHDRPPLSRWRADWKEKAAKGIQDIKM